MPHNGESRGALTAETIEVARPVAATRYGTGRHRTETLSTPLTAMILFASAFSVVLMATAVSAGGTFAPPYSDVGQDTDGDDRFNFLEVSVNFTGDPGEYLVEGRLHDPSHSFRLFAANSSPGYTVRLSYDGREINASGVDGPYMVDLNLYYWTCLNEEIPGECDPWDYGWLLTDSDTHETAAYAHIEFEEPVAYFTPPHADTGVDTDSDGRFDLLQVDVNVTVGLAGTYRVGGQLLGASPSLNLSASRNTFLEIGAHTVRLSYDGLLINLSAVDGPYTVDLQIRDFATSKLFNRYTHTTAGYRHTDFEEPPGLLWAPHVDAGQDTDGDGRFNSLQVDVMINVTVDDDRAFRVEGLLHDASNALNLSSQTVAYGLEFGVQTVRLSYDGWKINQTEVDGPYAVDLKLWDYRTPRPLDTSTHTTGSYRHVDFEGPAVSFAPPHADSGRDTDGDGRFNFLAVGTRIAVDDAGSYRLSGRLYGGAAPTLIATEVNISSLDPGYRTIDLLFPGRTINESGVDGPYRVVLELYQEVPFRAWGSEIYDTAPYLHSDFEEPPTIASSPTTIVPLIDGEYDSREWADAAAVDLVPEYVNGPSALLLVKNDNDFLYVAYDAIGDVTADDSDAASIAFDSWNDGNLTVGQEDKFVQGELSSDQRHLTFDFSCYCDCECGYWCCECSCYGDWFVEDSPYDPNLPGHAGLSSASGFGPSNGSSESHRIYEFKLPLTLLEIRSDGTIGLFGRVSDAGAGTSSIWPQIVNGPLPLSYYGDLHFGPDSIPPSVAISFPVRDAVLGVDTIEVAWNATDGRSGIDHYELSLDGGPSVMLPASTTTYTLSALAEGSHTIAVKAFDLVGNSAADSVSMTIDLTSPELIITAPAPGGLFRTADVPVTWTASDGLSGLDRIELSLDGDPPIVLCGGATTFTFVEVPDGVHTILATAFDLAGNSASDSVSLTIDATPPDLAITSPAPGTFFGSGDVPLAWVVSDAMSGLDWIEVQLDAETPVVLPPDSTTYLFSGVSEGDHVVLVTAYDVAGHPASDATSFAVDTTSPSLTVLSPTPGPIGSSSIDVAWVAQDNDAGLDRIQVQLDAGASIPLPADSTTYTFTGVPDGSHTIGVTAFDLVGNSASDSVTVIVDTTAPGLSISSPAPGTFFGSGEVPVTWTASDAVSGLDRIEVRVDGGTPVVLQPDATSYTFRGLSEGFHLIEVTAFNRVGNFRMDSLTVAIDTNAPTAAIAAPTPGALLATSAVEVRWTASDSGSGIDRFDLILDEAPPIVLAATETSYIFMGMEDGAHRITLRSVDVVGNVAVVGGGFTVDTGPPFVSIASPFDAAFVGGSAVALTWTASDSLSGVDHVRVSLDAGAPVVLPADATGYTFSGVTDGSHTVVVTAIDLAGNFASDSVGVTVDTAPPVVAITSPASGTVFGAGSVPVTWTSSDATSGVDRIEVRLDGSPPIVLSGSATTYTFAAVGDGVHTATVTAIDEAGNFGVATASFSVDTAVWSPSGPYGAVPLIGTFIGIAVVALGIAVLLQRRRRPGAAP